MKEILQISVVWYMRSSRVGEVSDMDYVTLCEEIEKREEEIEKQEEEIVKIQGEI